MRNAVETSERVTGRERQRLTCHACGAGNPMSKRVLDDGFQRCDRCGTAMPVAGAGRYAFESTGFTLVISPGRSSFVVRYMRLFSLPGWFCFLLLGELASVVLGKLFAGPAGLEQFASIPFYVYLGLASAMFLLLATRQRVLLVANRIEIAWRVFGLRIFHRRFGTHSVRLTVRSRWPRGLWIRSRAGIPAWIGTDDEQEAKALKKEIEIAIGETRQPVGVDRLRCPGCGAPVATRIEVIERRGAECPHCESGIVAVKGGVVLEDCSIDVRLDREPGRSRSRTPRRDGSVEWRVGSEFSRNPTRALGLWSFGLLFGGGMALFGGGITLLTEEWRAFGLIVAMIFVPFGLGLLCYFTISFFGSHRIEMDASALERDLHLGRLRVRRRLVPLARLLALHGKSSVNSVELNLRTPMREVDIELPDPAGEGAAGSPRPSSISNLGWEATVVKHLPRVCGRGGRLPFGDGSEEFPGGSAFFWSRSRGIAGAVRRTCVPARLPGMRTPIAVCVTLAALVSCAPPPPESADLVVRNARVFVGDGSVLEDATVVVADGRIVAMGDEPGDWKGTEEIDGAGKTVLPGLIDSHVHLLALSSESADTVAKFRTERLPGILTDFLESGITTVRSTGDPLNEILEVREELRSGSLRGPRLLTAGPVLTSVDGHPAVTVCGGGSWQWCRENVVRELPDADAARAAVVELAEAGVDFIKFVNDPNLGQPLDGAVVEAVIEAGHANDLEVVAHILARPLVREALEARLDGLVHMTFGLEEIDDATLPLFAERPISPTLGLIAPVDDGEGGRKSSFGADWNEESQALYDTMSESLRRLWDAGAPLAFGTDTPWFQPPTSWSHESEALLGAGFTPADVLVMATGNGARAIGLRDELGRVEVGKRADLLLVDGRPDEDLAALRDLVIVLQGGNLAVDRR